MADQNVKSILVAVDFSVCSRAALLAAAEWANQLGASIDVLHVWMVSSFPLLPAVADDHQVYDALIDGPRRKAEAELARFVESASNSGIYVRHATLEFGEVAGTICEKAARGAYDLLVLGTHGHSGLSRMVLGSIAEKVVRSAPCPVLTVHAPAERSIRAA